MIGFQKVSLGKRMGISRKFLVSVNDLLEKFLNFSKTFDFMVNF